MPFTTRGPWPFGFPNQPWSQHSPEYNPMTYPGPTTQGPFPYPAPQGWPAFTWPIVPMPEQPHVYLPQIDQAERRSPAMSPLMAFLSGDGEDYEENPEAVPALFDPEADEPSSYEMCVDRCHQANRRDIRDCYKKRGRVAKAICIAAANARNGSCINACQKYKRR